MGSMKRSVRVTLTVAAGVALISCNRRLDPCESASFNQQACQDAVQSGGYYWNGTWFPMTYSHPYPFYYDSYQQYRAKGGTSSAAPGITYGRPSGSSSSGVERGGFGATGEGHAGGSAGE